MTSSRLLCCFATLTTMALATLALAQGPTPAPAQPRADGRCERAAPSNRTILLDRVVAIVNDEALTQYEIDDQKKTILTQMKLQKVTPPAPDVLDKQLSTASSPSVRSCSSQKKTVCGRRHSGRARAASHRAGQQASPDEFRRALRREGIEYEKYREDIRKEIVIQRLREREVDSRVMVTDSEVEAFLASQNAQAGGDAEYRVSHILVLVPEKASPDQIDAKRRRAEEALKQVSDGTDFAQVAAGFSDAPDALQGGGLGWRTVGDVCRPCSWSRARDEARRCARPCSARRPGFTSSSCRRRAAAMRRRSSSRPARGTS